MPDWPTFQILAYSFIPRLQFAEDGALIEQRETMFEAEIVIAFDKGKSETFEADELIMRLVYTGKMEIRKEEVWGIVWYNRDLKRKSRRLDTSYDGRNYLTKLRWARWEMFVQLEAEANSVGRRVGANHVPNRYQPNVLDDMMAHEIDRAAVKALKGGGD